MPASPAEPSLAEQIAAVAADESDEIRITTQSLNDDDLQPLADLPRLHALIIDSGSSHVTAAGIRLLADLPDLAHLRLRGTGIDDDALAEIARIESLTILNVPRGEFGDAGLEHLQSLPRLVQLRLGSPRVTDAGMKTVAAMPALKRLHLIGLPLTDAALADVAGMEGLESFYVDEMRFSDEAWKMLFTTRPKLHVHIDQAHHDRDPHRHPH